LSIGLEAGKLVMTLFIDADANFANEKSHYKFKSMNFNIHEDLGLVKYIFTDKTGTLTSNNLTF
jgi:P-type E1-E2 ATPase